MNTGLSLIQRIHERGLELELEAVLSAVGMSAAQLLSRRRQQRYIDARRMFYRRLRARGLSYPAIGHLVGRSHTTIMTALGAR